MEHKQQPTEKLEFIEKKVDKILLLLSGDHEIDRQDEGLVGDVRNLKLRVYRLERWKDRVIYFLIGISFAAGWGISDLLNYIKHIPASK